jgi:CRP-like cAMP-binding protein
MAIAFSRAMILGRPLQKQGNRQMTSPLIRKLEQFAKLFDEDKRALEDATKEVRTYGPRQEIITEGDRPNDVHLILEGWAGRYKLLPNGDRPIMAYLIPGDLCDIHIALLNQMDHSIATLSACKVASIPCETMGKLLENNWRLARAMWWATLVDEAVLREWLVTVGHRSADKRLAHLICEMLLRSKAVGLTSDDSFEMPLTQEELGDTMGLSTVHVNRMLQELRGRDLITSSGRRVIVNDRERLFEFAEFNPNYLHQEIGRAQG